MRQELFGVVGLARIALAGLVAIVYGGCSDPNQSFQIYRLPYADGTKIFVSRDHITHTPPNRIDLVGVDGTPPYAVVAAQTGIIRFIEDGHTEVCCGGNCANNYVWIEHVTGEWTKYSHLDTNSVTVDAGLSVGDIVMAGEFLGWESDIGRACGVHLHFEVGVPNDPQNPLHPGNGGFINGTNRIPRFCGVQPQVLEAGTTVTAVTCGFMLDCIQSIESPTTVGTCQPGLDGSVCVQQVQGNAIGSTYIRGEDFQSTSVKIDLEWCADATCNPDQRAGRAVLIVVFLDQDLHPNADPIEFIAYCDNRRITEVVHGVESIVITHALNLGPENLACDGNTFGDPFARWEICDVTPAFASM